MSERISPATKHKYGIEMVCRVWKFPRSSFYQAKKEQGVVKSKRGKRSKISDNQLLTAIKEDIKKSYFQGEGHRKIHARLRRSNDLQIGRNRVLRVMREHKLLSPYRNIRVKENQHDGRITTDQPNIMWATDATKILTVEDGWVWFFGVLEHWNAECLGWHLSKKGDRFAAIEALNQAIECVFGDASQDVARGVLLRIDHGPQFISEGFVNQARYWGIGISKGFVREPETNGVIERFHRTFKEQIVNGKQYRSIEDFRSSVLDFTRKYNEHWLIEKLNFHSPKEARRLYQDGKNVLKQRTNLSRFPEQGKEHGYCVLAGDETFEQRVDENSPCPIA